MQKIAFLFSCCLLVTVVLSGCSKGKNNSPYEGTWVYDHNEEEVFVYQRAAKLDNDKAGYIFKQNGDLVRRDVLGWCLTPPVSYENYDGTWSNSGNDKLAISSERWDGTFHYTIEIVSVTGHTLRVRNKY